MIDVHHIEQISQDCSLTEFVGTTVLDTIGLVIPGIDPSLLEKMNLKKPYKSLGLILSLIHIFPIKDHVPELI